MKEKQSSHQLSMQKILRLLPSIIHASFKQETARLHLGTAILFILQLLVAIQCKVPQIILDLDAEISHEVKLPFSLAKE